MTDRNDDPSVPMSDESPFEVEGRVHDDEGLHPAGEGLSETPIHATYEAIALHNDLARQLEGAVATARALARSDGSPESHAIADALGEIFDRVGAPSESETT
jgi:hypothetical protein